MPVHNTDVATIFRRIADLLAIEGANEFRVRAYRDAARTIETLSRPVAEMVEAGEDLSQLEGIGEDLAGKIEEIVETGELEMLQEIEARTPPALAEMLRIEGLGPKRVRALHEALGVRTLDELKQTAEQGRVRQVAGFGQKLEQRIVHELERAHGRGQRTRLDVADELVPPLVDYLQKVEGVERVVVAGSYRRRKETVGDLDILVTGEDGGQIGERFTQYEDVEDVLSQGETRSAVRLRQGIDVDLRVVAAESYGAALFYFTGSKDHNIHLRKIALDQDLTVNEYGVFKKEGAAEEGEGGGERGVLKGERVAGAARLVEAGGRDQHEEVGRSEGVADPRVRGGRGPCAPSVDAGAP